MRARSVAFKSGNALLQRVRSQQLQHRSKLVPFIENGSYGFIGIELNLLMTFVICSGEDSLTWFTKQKWPALAQRRRREKNLAHLAGERAKRVKP